jgi:hypothetical protein
MLLSMGLLPNILHHWLGNGFALAWHPLMALLYAGIIVMDLAKGRLWSDDKSNIGETGVLLK